MQKNTMQEGRHILLPIDFSERCGNVVPFVVSIARRYSAKATRAFNRF